MFAGAVLCNCHREWAHTYLRLLVPPPLSGQWWWYTTFTASFGILCHVDLEQLAIQEEMLVATNRREMPTPLGL